MDRIVAALILSAVSLGIVATSAAADPGVADRVEDPYQVPSLEEATPGGEAPTAPVDLGAAFPGNGGDLDVGPLLTEALPAPNRSAPPEAHERPAAPDLGPPSTDVDVPVPRVPDGEALVVGPAPAADAREPHPTIVIRGDEGPTGFALARDPVTGTPVPRPGSGVVAGSGAAEDPYVIQGWDVAGIRIEDTDAHVRIVDNRIRDPPDGPGLPPTAAQSLQAETPLILEDADNATVVGNDIVNPDARDATGIAATGADELTIEGNTLGPDLHVGIALEGGGDVTVREQPLEDLYVGLFAGGVEGLDLRASTVTGGDHGLVVVRPDDVTVTENRAGDLRTFVTLVDDDEAPPSRDAEVTRNVVSGPGDGVFLGSGVGAEVRGNTFSGVSTAVGAREAGVVDVVSNTLVKGDGWSGWNGVGVAVDGAADARVRANTFRAVWSGISVTGTSEPAVTGNVIRDAVGGIHVGGSPSATVANNDVHASFVGVFLSDLQDPDVDDTDVEDARYAYALDAVEGGSVAGAEVVGERYGFLLFDGTTEARVRGNQVDEAAVGVWIADAPRNRFDDNAFGSGGFYLAGDERQHLHQSIPPSNTMNDQPIRYVWNATDTTLSLPGEQAIVAASRNVTVDAGRYREAVAGILVTGSRNVTVDGGDLNGNTIGAAVLESTDVTLQRPEASANEIGVGVLHGNGTAVRGPQIVAGYDDVGVLGLESPDVAVVGGTVEGTDVGVSFEEARRPTVRDVEVRRADVGIHLEDTRNATLEGNNPIGDVIDIYLQGGENATLQRNDLEGAGLTVRTFEDRLPNHRIPPNNTLRGDPIRYHEAPTHLSVSSPAGQVVLLEPRNVTIQDLDLEGTVEAHRGHDLTVDETRVDGYVGLHVSDHAGLVVENSTLESDRHGALLFDVPDARIHGNTQTDWGQSSHVRLGLVVDGAGADVTGNALDQGLLVPPGQAGLTVENNTVEGDPVRYLDGASDLRIDEPTGQVLLHEADNVTVVGRSLRSAGIAALADDSRNITVETTEILRNGIGILAWDTANLSLRNVRLEGNVRGVDVGEGSATLRNVLVEPPQFRDALVGIDAADTDLQVEGSTITGYDRGINAWWSSLDVRATNVTGNDRGIYASPGFRTPIVAHGNNIVDNEEAGTTVFDEDADLTGNWWGCPEGPDDPDCDDATGDAQVYPVLEEPNPDAGFDPFR